VPAARGQSVSGSELRLHAPFAMARMGQKIAIATIAAAAVFVSTSFARVSKVTRIQMKT